MAGWTKKQLVIKAFGEIGLAPSSGIELSADQLQEGLSSLDAMMAEWDGVGIRLGYPIPSSPDAGNLDDPSNVPPRANRAVYANLAVAIASGIGRAVSQTLLTTAKHGYDALFARAASTPPRVQLPRMTPAGAGHRWRGPLRPFLGHHEDPIEAGPDSDLDIDK